MPPPRQNPYRNYYYSSRRQYQQVTPRSYVSQPTHTANTPQPHRRKHHVGRTFGLVLVLLVALLGVHIFTSRQTSAHDVPKSIRLHEASAATTNRLSQLSSQIQGVLQSNALADFSVSITDLGNNHTQHFGDTAPFTAASVGKLITAADFLHEVENGQQSLSENMSGSSAQYELQQMIVVSDDTAWEALNNILGYSNLQTYAQSLGLSSFQSMPNTITSDDMASLLQKLYDGSLLKDSDTNLLLSWMKQANYRDYIVPAVPSTDTVYHKVGLYEDFVNDAAIITNGRQTIVLVIFTNGNGSYNWTARAQAMQQITRDVLTTYLN